MFVEEILQNKGHDVLTIRPTASVREVVQRLSLERVGALVVSEDGERLQGIISEPDVIRSLARRGATLLDERVSDVMMRSVSTCAPDDKLKSVMAVMTQKRVRHMPVLEGGGAAMWHCQHRGYRETPAGRLGIEERRDARRLHNASIVEEPLIEPQAVPPEFAFRRHRSPSLTVPICPWLLTGFGTIGTRKTPPRL